MTTLLPGENRLLTRQFVQADGVTPLLISSLASVSVALEQGGAVLARYTLGTDSQLRAGPDASSVTLELVTAFTSSKKGAIRERWTLIAANAAFVAEPSHDQVDRIVLDDISIST